MVVSLNRKQMRDKSYPLSKKAILRRSPRSPSSTVPELHGQEGLTCYACMSPSSWICKRGEFLSWRGSTALLKQSKRTPHSGRPDKESF